ncbi:MAG TPA: hypothetical protein VKE51_32365 [Vicinamibacterales bacterium]|nr:hypothetical protein [Vicinamibacterales bacterium]
MISQHSKPFAEDLAQLIERLVTMGTLAEARLRLALRGLVDRQPLILSEVIA